MKSKTKLIPFISFLLLFLFAIVGTNVLSLGKSFTADAVEFYTGCLTVNVIDRKDKVVSTNHTTTYNGEKAYIYNWEDVKKFTFSFEVSPGVAETNFTTFTFRLQVYYKQAYKDEVWTNAIPKTFTELTETGENSYLKFNDISETFSIDDITTVEYNGAKAEIGTWGIYKFRVTINNIEYDTSDFFIIEPTQEVLEAPKIAYETTSSKTGLRNAYNFHLTNYELYQFIDRSNLKWYGL